MHVGQTIIAPTITIRQLFVIEAQLVQDRRMQIMDMDTPLRRMPSKLVRRPVG